MLFSRSVWRLLGDRPGAVSLHPAVSAKKSTCRGIWMTDAPPTTGTSRQEGEGAYYESVTSAGTGGPVQLLFCRSGPRNTFLQLTLVLGFIEVAK
jgi:hypothetical protein